MASLTARFAGLTAVRRHLLTNMTISAASSTRFYLDYSHGQSMTPPQSRRMVVVTQSKASEREGDHNTTFAKVHAGTEHASDKGNIDVLNVTDSCMGRIEKLVEQRKKAGEDGDRYYLRVYVDSGGCSGFQYKFEMDCEDLEEEDVVVRYAASSSSNEGEKKVPRLVVDEISLNYIRGSKIDYVQEMIKSSFEISENPQSESACGCGSSFAVKNFAANPAID